MWIFTTFGFFSIVAHRDRPGDLLVRARVKTDLVALRSHLGTPRNSKLPRILITEHADYRFRMTVPADELGQLLAQEVETINYDNFKNAVAQRQGGGRALVYHDVWHDLLPLQRGPGGIKSKR